MFKDTLKKLLAGSTALAFAALPILSEPVSAQNIGALYQTGSQNGQAPMFVPGDAIVAGPAIPAFTFTGSITVATTGSFTTATLSVTPPGTSQTPVIPYGTVISGSGVTTGTTTIAYLGSNNYWVVAPSGTVAAVASETLTATPAITASWQDTLQKTAPTYASGGCTTTPSFASGATPFSFTLTQGASGCGSNSTITLTLPAAATTWSCVAVDTTTPARVIRSTGAASTTAVVLTDYTSAGVAETMLASDVYAVNCIPH